jgi:hypothetical protein
VELKAVGTSDTTQSIGRVQTTTPAVYQQDAFGAQRVTSPFALHDQTFRYGILSDIWESSTAVSGTVTNLANESAARLAVIATTGSFAKLRTNTYFRYQAGRGQRILMTVYHADTGQINQVRTWGYGDTSNGLFFQLSGTTLQLVRRTYTSGAPVDNVVTQTNWNADRMDGTGPSGTVLDVTKGNIYEISVEWLGVGIVRFFINGQLVHTMNHPNSLTVPYMSTGTLPITAEVENTGASTGASMTFICSTVYSEGGQTPPLFSGSYVGAAVTTAGAGEAPAFSIRMKATLNGVDNRTVCLPVSVNGDNSTATAGASAVVVVRQNATLTNPTWAVDPGALYGVEIDTGATAVSDGMVIARFVVPSTESADYDLAKLFNFVGRMIRRTAFTGTSDTLTVSILRQGAVNVTVTPTLIWNEVK